MTSVSSITTPISSSQSSTLDPNINNTSSSFSSICFESNSVSKEVSAYGSVLNSSKSLCHANQLPPNIVPGAINHIIEASDLMSKKLCPVNVTLINALIRGYHDKSNSLALTTSIREADLVYNLGNKNQNMIDGVQTQSNVPSKCSIDEDTRALQLAVELTMINLNKSQQSVSTSSIMTLNDKCHEKTKSQILRPPTGQPYSPVSPYRLSSKNILETHPHIIHTAPLTLSNQNIQEFEMNDSSRTNSLTDINQALGHSVVPEDRSKKSQNMTECVPVPSSEHVAEIVGRQGCKIKALRAKTNTYIKTPVRNEEPVFVVTGRKEDVSKAKLEILSAAEHFTVIRATRRLNDHIVTNSYFPGNKQQILGLCKNNLSTTSPTQGQVTIQVRVPYKLVGLVVGTKGNTIKHIQQETQTYIVTPSRDKEPIFEVTGLADNVELARRHIEIHIATRIGSSQNNSMTSVSSPSPSHCATIRLSTEESAESSLQSLNALNQILNDDIHSDILTSIYKNGICSTFDSNHIGGSIINQNDKCNNLRSLNGFLGDINVTMLKSDSKRNESYSLTEHVSNQIKCVDFINNLMDTNVQQFGTDLRSKFT